jgi:hypothetical protein
MVQVDDLFLQTDTYGNPTRITRMSAADFSSAATWQVNFNAGLPAGSSFK